MITLHDLEQDYREAGGLSESYCSGWVSFGRGDSEICLDGDFNLDELRAIVKFLENREAE